MNNLSANMLALKPAGLALLIMAAFAVPAPAQDFAGPFEAEFEATTAANAAPQAIEQQDLPVEAFWEGADAATIEPLLATVQPELLSPTVRALLIDLLQNQNPPAGASNSYLTTQLAHLGELGALSAVATLSAQALEGPDGPAIAQSYIGALLLDKGLETACEAQANIQTDFKQGPHWARLEAVCFTLNDQTLQADLALEIVAEAQTPDPLFDKLYEILTSSATSPAELPPIQAGAAFSTALHLAMIRASGLDPALIGVTADQALTRLTLVRASGAPLAQRIFAAEHALAAQQISADELADLYAAAYELVRSEAEITLPDTLQDAALHFNVIQNLQLGLESIPAIAAAFQEAAARGTLNAVARLYADAASQQDPAQASDDDAALIARGLLSIGLFADAKPWFMVSYQAARAKTPGAFEKMNRAWPLIAMADDTTTPRGIQKLAAGWRTTQSLAKENEGAARRRAILLFTLLEGFGRPVDETLWGPLLSIKDDKSYHAVDPALWRGMEAAAARGERGMTLSLLLTGLSQAALPDHHPAYLASVLKSLQMINMADASHTLAAEALLAAGF